MAGPYLLPCPFCGCTATMRDDASHSTGVYYGCDTLGCLGTYLWDETEAEAIAAWNRRAPTPLAAALEVPEVRLLVLALNQYQLAAAGYVSAQSARDKADAALAALKGGALRRNSPDRGIKE